MKRSNRLILLIGVFLAVVTFVGIVLILGSGGRSGSGTPQTPTELPTVFATTDIPLGTVIRADMLKTEARPVTSRDTTAFQDPSLVIGKVVRTNVVEGKQLTAADFTSSQAPTTIDCPPTLRCMAITTDQHAGVGTLIRTGDYVDLVVAFQMNIITVDPDTGAPTAAPEVTGDTAKLLLQGAQVVGTLLPPVPPPAEGGPPAGEAGTPLSGQQEIVVVAVTAQQAEVIKFAQVHDQFDNIAFTGTHPPISLVLRSPGDFRDPTTQDPIVPVPDSTTGITLSILVDEYGVLIPEVLEATLPEQEQP